MLDDVARLQALAALGDQGPGDAASPLQTVARLAALICGTPMAAVSLLGADEQVFVGSVGLAVDRTDRESSFCAVAMETPQVPLVVLDTAVDERFATNRLVLGDPHLRFYAGVPLVVGKGVPVGAVCALGDQPQSITEVQLDALSALGELTQELLQARRTTVDLQKVLIELTAAQEAQTALREQFATVFDAAGTGMTLADDQGVYVRVNQAFAVLLGYAASELVGRDFRDITDGDGQADVAAVAGLLSGERRSVLREKRYRHRDGSLVPALVSTSLIRADDGSWLVLSHVESVAERRAAESRLVELHSAVDGIVSIDGHGIVVAWNLGAERFLGYAAADMLGRSLDRIIPAGMQQAHRSGVARVSAGGIPRLVGETIEVPVVHADGHELAAELSLSAWTQDGRSYYTAILRDITERRRSQTHAALMRHAASTANSADTFPTAAAAVLRDVCDNLGWLAGHAWTASGDPAVWHVADHAHHDPDDCHLAGLAAQGAAPDSDQLALDTRTRVASGPQELPGLGHGVDACGIGPAVAVPVLAGGEVAGMIAFYLPRAAAVPQPDLIDALEQIGLTLGRVVERQRTAATLVHQATHDPVTDLANRRRLLAEISQAQQHPSSGEHPPHRSAVLLINLDRFRVINDSIGYAAGDEVLQQVAARLRHAAADTDLVARLSADEFVIVAHRPTENTDPDDLAPFRILAHTVQQHLQAAINVVGHRVPLRASIGICPITTDHAAAPHYPAGVLRDADIALRHAKRRGKDQICVFDAALRRTAAARVDDETALGEAITHEHLVVYYQPIIDLASGRPTGVEALVRWQRPGHGMIAPDHFIPLAEESGLIVDLGRWVLRQACADAAAWPITTPVLAGASVSVNVSTRQLTHPRFLHDLDAALTDTGLPATRLIVEITETAFIEDSDAVMVTLHAVRERGVQIALDDFGTGYSSLSYVQKLPVTILKIDKSFVDPITGPGQGTTMSEVVLKLAEATGLRTIAEGIETFAQADALRHLGCHRGQGYTWSRPVPNSHLATTLAALAETAPIEALTVGIATRL